MSKKGKMLIPIVSVLIFIIIGMTWFAATAMSEGSCNHQWILQNQLLPTCTETGQESYKCSFCGEEFTVSVAALGHEWGVCTIVLKATCAEDGLIRCYCTRDDSHYEDKVLPATGHDWGEWSILREATLGTPGIRERKCHRCGSTEQQQIHEQIYRNEYELTLFMLSAPYSPDSLLLTEITEKGEYELAFECVLINTGRKDLRIRSYCLNKENQEQQFEAPLNLPAGQLDSFQVIRTVTEADIRRDSTSESAGGIIESEYYFFGETENGEPACMSNTVTLTCRVCTEPENLPREPDPGIRVTQEIVSEPIIAKGYQPGEVIQYTVSIVNQSDRSFAHMTLKGIKAEETVHVTDIQPGETRTISCEHYVTVQDALKGYICFIKYLWEEEEKDSINPVRSNVLVFPIFAK